MVNLFNFSKMGGAIVLLLMLSLSISAQQIQVRGTVVDEYGDPAIGATVLVRGTLQGTTTDINGNFTISAPADGTLVVSFIGYRTQDVPVSANVSVRLVPDAELLDEVIVTAMGIRRERRALGFAVQDIDSESIGRTGAASLATALQGKTVGMTITPSSGMPGASSQMVIRGARSFTGNNAPLFVVDGMPIASNPTYGTGNSVSGTDFSNRALDINPNDIESISILRGQAATALYGLRASNGVIIITTRSGQGGPTGRPVVTINQTTSFERVSRVPDLQDTWAQGINGNFDPMHPQSWGPRISELPNDSGFGGNIQNSNTQNRDAEGRPIAGSFTLRPGMFFVPQRATAGLDPWMTPQVFNNFTDYFRTGITSTTGVTVSQALDRGHFSVGLGYTDQTGIALNTGMSRMNARALAETRLTDRFTVGFSANYVATRIDRLSGANDSSVIGAIAAPRSYNLRGMPFHIPGDPFTQLYFRGGSFDNPFWVAENNTFNEKVNRFFGNTFLQYATALSSSVNLNVRYQLGVDTYTTHHQMIFGFGSAARGGTGSIENFGATRTTYNSLLTASLDWHISEDFRLNAVIGNEINHSNLKSYSQLGQVFNFGGWNHINNTNVQSLSESQSQSRTVGFFANIDVSWRDMVYWTVTGRSDRASTMPRGNRTFFYPSTSLSFVASELDAIRDIHWLSFARLRASVAEVGQAGTFFNPFYVRPGYGGGFWFGAPITYPIAGINAYVPSATLYDPNLRPQNTRSYELGATFNFLNNRLGVDYAYSRQDVTDQIFPVPLAGSTGASQLFMNGGSITTNMHEFTLNFAPVRTRDFTWDVSLNYSTMVNKVNSLAPGVENIFLGGFVTPQVRAGIGNTFPVIFGSTFARNEFGQILVNEDPNSLNYGMPMAGAPGVIGEVTPDFILGGTNILSFRNLTLAATFEWQHGGSMYLGTQGVLRTFGMVRETEDRTSTFIFPGYRADGTPNNIVRGGADDPLAVQRLNANVLGAIDESFVFDKSFVKLRELSLSYAFPRSIIPRADLSVNAFARNILLWTELPNFDPEATQGNNNMAGAFERFSLPQATSFGVGLNITF